MKLNILILIKLINPLIQDHLNIKSIKIKVNELELIINNVIKINGKYPNLLYNDMRNTNELLLIILTNNHTLIILLIIR